MIGVYFSGTGNSKFVLRSFLEEFDTNINMFSIEDEGIVEKIKKSQDIVLAYPVYYSNIPFILREFIVNNKEIWKGKKVYLIATMGLFSGDGTGYVARILKKYDTEITGGCHIKMPDCIIDVKLLKKDRDKELTLLKEAEVEAKRESKKLIDGIPSRQGLGKISHITGLFGQRFWFNRMVSSYRIGAKIQDSCVSCGKCVKVCPMENLSVEGDFCEAGNSCTLCYRCVHICPTKSITVLGSKVCHESLNLLDL